MPPPTPHRTQNSVPQKQNLIWYLHCCCPGQNSPLKGFQSKTRSTFSKRILPTEYYDVKEWSASPLVSSPEHSLVFVTDKISKLAKGWARCGGGECHQIRDRGCLFSRHLVETAGVRSRQAGWLFPLLGQEESRKDSGGKSDGVPESVSHNQLVMYKLQGIWSKGWS